MLKPLALLAMIVSAQAAFADTLPTENALVTVTAIGSVTAPNDEAQLVFGYEEQGKDKAALASSVNLRLKQGIAALKKASPNARLSLDSYRTYAVYDEALARIQKREAQQTGWRVSQDVRLVTGDFAALPATVASTQKVLTLKSVVFGLSEETRKKLEQRRVEAAYRSLEEQVAFIAGAMRRPVADAKLESLDFGSQALEQKVYVTGSRLRREDSGEVEEPNLQPGESKLELRATAKLRFK
ncbi:Predicted secreted protein [Duganella sp. CF458]|uniref:SIMPL domain-containing protein n=1 Tax=Duganella sp. CF458 TaxID=1884368 RepID=UPI0008E3EC3F|nr:SIMPL domain-containing protein [Duganella sp. CF458]SFG92199.1 Predicted secreted protein [Duganella sp. CF458]